MADRNEVRVSDQDMEMLAIKAIAAAVEPLDEDAARRVLDWATNKYLHTRLAIAQKSSDAWLKGIAEGLDVVNKGAQAAGVTPRHMLLTIERMYREATKAAEADAAASDKEQT